MGIVSFSYTFARMPVLSVLLAPLQMLVALFVPANPVCGRALARPASKLTCDALAAPVKGRVEPVNHTMVKRPCPRQAETKNTCASLSPKSSISRLKILREFDPGIGRTYAGRMIISGRMADVCAELERMEQRERTASHH